MNKKKKANLDFHVEADDYFITLATVLNSMRYEIERAQKEMEKNYHETQKLHKFNKRYLQEAKADLLYLQKHYKITKKQRL